eukprot:scpid68313/ scgid28825/ 
MHRSRSADRHATETFMVSPMSNYFQLRDFLSSLTIIHSVNIHRDCGFLTTKALFEVFEAEPGGPRTPADTKLLAQQLKFSQDSNFLRHHQFSSSHQLMLISSCSGHPQPERHISFHFRC